MKKKLKKWQIVLLSFLLLLLAVGGYVLYTFKFKEYDVADPEVKKITEETFTVKLPDGTEIVLDGNGKIINKNGAPFTITGKTTNGNGANPSTTTANGNGATTPSTNESATKGANATPSTEKPTVADIKNKYTSTFASLEAQANGKLNGLIGRAMSEYSTKRAKGESINFGYFYNKYMGAATGLEASTDAAFYSLLSIVEADLEANGYNKSYAQNLVSDYEAAKEARRNGLLEKVKKAM